MGATHGHGLHYHGHSPVHRFPAHLKMLALLAFVLAVVATPATAWWAFALDAALLLAVQRVSRVPAGYVAARMVVELPFVVFALLMPVVATGPRVDLGPVSLSEAGLLGGWALLVKGTLGVLASLVLATTTEPREVVTGLQRLRLPATLVEILAFMIRYLEVVTEEMRRMHLARVSRGFTARSVRQWPALASSAAALFIRSYERGERVHLAMLSRGYTGALPVAAASATTPPQRVVAAAVPALAAAVALAAGVLA